MKIESPVFNYGEPIPERYSRYGDNRSPPLVFRNVPGKTRTLALIVDDPDAAHGTFTHWIVFNLDPTCAGLEEATPLNNARQGNNGWGEAHYGGPRPPDGEHRYFFKLYALDRKLDLPVGAERDVVEEAMRGHIVAEAKTMGRFMTPPPATRKAVEAETARH